MDLHGLLAAMFVSGNLFAVGVYALVVAEVPPGGVFCLSVSVIIIAACFAYMGEEVGRGK